MALKGASCVGYLKRPAASVSFSHSYSCHWMEASVITLCTLWPGSVMITALDCAFGHGFNSRPFFFQVTVLVLHTHVPLLVSPSGMNWCQSWAVLPYSWEGNLRSGASLAMHHRLKWFIHLQAQWSNKGVEHPTCILKGLGRLLRCRRLPRISVIQCFQLWLLLIPAFVRNCSVRFLAVQFFIDVDA